MIKKIKGNLLATAMITLSSINDGATGPQGPSGPPGDVKDHYDSSFMEGTTYWSTSYSSNAKPNNNVTLQKESTSEIGGNVLQVAGQEQWMYAKNKLPIEKNKIYRFTFRVRQTQDPLNGSDKNKIYAGATTFNANGDRLSVNNGNYFIASSTPITVSQGWRTYTAYMSTTAKPAIINGSNQTLCPAVKAFDTGTIAIKPMFIVNYTGGNGIAQVDGLTMEDYTETWNGLDLLKDKLNNSSQEVFDALTDGGKIQGIYMQNGQLYVNGQYINAKNLRVTDNSNNLTLGIDSNGNITIRATTLTLGSKPIATEEKVTTEIDNIKIGCKNLTDNTNFYDGLKDWGVINGATSPILDTGRVNESSIAIKVTLGNTNGSGIITPKTSCIGGNKYVSSFWIKVTKDCKVGQLLKFRDSAGTETNPISAVYTTVKANVWTHIVQAFTAPTTAVSMNSTPRIETAIGTGIFMYLTEYMLEEGTKSSTWGPSNNDIEDGKISTGGAIDDVNNSNGQIQYPRLNIQGMVSFTDMDENIMKHYEIKTDSEGKITETLINGATIKTGTVTAEKMEMYNLSVIRRRKNSAGIWESIDTSFNINEEGHIRASGTFSSFNFNPETKDVGWQINENGDSVFNNTIVRGRVELPSAGLTDYGGKSKPNLLKNTIYANGTSSFDLAAGCALDTNVKYHAHNTIKMDISGLTADGWRGATPKIADSPVVKAGEIISCQAAIFIPLNKGEDANKNPIPNNVDANIALEIQFYKADNTRLSTITAQANKNLRDKWQIIKLENKAVPKDAVKANCRVWMQRNGLAYSTELKLEKNAACTDWISHSDDKISLTRFWAGDTYEERDGAPFRVLQDGTVVATRGEFGGTFTGRVEIGNIKIYDTNTTPGVIEINNKDDVKTIVKLGEESSFFNSPVFFGNPAPTGSEKAAAFKITPNTGRMDVLTEGSIVLSNNSNKNIAIQNTTTGASIVFGSTVQMIGQNNALDIKGSTNGKIVLNIGNFADAGAHDDVSVNIDGSMSTKSLSIGPVRIFENLDGDGIDFYIDN